MDIARLILTTDFSDCSEHAFSPAAAIARRAGAEIDLVNVAGALPPFAFGHTGAATTLDAFHRESEARLAEVARRPVFDGLSVHCHVLDGFGPEAIDEFHDEVGQDLVVTATHGHAGLKRLVLGSFAERVVRLVKCPALVFRGDSEATDFAPRRILFSHDFSQLSAAALPRLRSLATEFDARIFACTSSTPSSIRRAHSGSGPPSRTRRLRTGRTPRSARETSSSRSFRRSCPTSRLRPSSPPVPPGTRSSRAPSRATAT